MTMQQAAATLGASEMVVRRLVAHKILPAKQVVKFAPWMIERYHLDLPSVRKETRRVHEGRRSDPDSRDSRTEENWIAKQFATSPKLPVRFFLEAGTFEVDKEGTGGDVLEATRTLRDMLLAKGYEVHFQQFVSGHDDLSWRGTFADGLITLFGQP